MEGRGIRTCREQMGGGGKSTCICATDDALRTVPAAKTAW